MPLEQQDIEFLERRIEKHIRKHLSEWLSEMSYAKPPQVYEIELRERMIRVEEELKNQRELMMQFMQQVDKRFEQVDKRFEQVDKRFEQVEQRIDKLSESIYELTLEIKESTKRQEVFIRDYVIDRDRHYDQKFARHRNYFLGIVSIVVAIILKMMGIIELPKDTVTIQQNRKSEIVKNR